MHYWCCEWRAGGGSLNHCPTAMSSIALPSCLLRLQHLILPYCSADSYKHKRWQSLMAELKLTDDSTSELFVRNMSCSCQCRGLDILWLRIRAQVVSRRTFGAKKKRLCGSSPPHTAGSRMMSNILPTYCTSIQLHISFELLLFCFCWLAVTSSCK